MRAKGVVCGGVSSPLVSETIFASILQEGSKVGVSSGSSGKRQFQLLLQ